MVIGEKFVWGHLGKTGGDATLHLFRLFPELLVRADDTESNTKHQLFSAHEPEIAGKLLALNIRRLPAWILSFAQHSAKRGLYPDYRPLPMMTADEMARCTAADETLAWFTSNGRFHIDRWLRTEYLRLDFLSFISEFSDVSQERRFKVLHTGAINVAPYEHDLGRWFDAAQICSMYKHNPVWAEIESDLYRDEARMSAAQLTIYELIRLAEKTGAQRDAVEKELRIVKLLLHKARLHAGNGLEDSRQWECIQRIREKVGQFIPCASQGMIASKGDEELIASMERKMTHFPQGEGGVYAGHYPADSERAIEHFQQQRTAGAQFIVFPKTAFWWLEHYGGFRSHLDAVGERVCADDDCIIYKFPKVEREAETAFPALDRP